MKRGVKIGLLSILIARIDCTSAAAQNEIPLTTFETFETFADWCLNRDRLTSEAQHTVENLLEKVEAQECSEAEDTLASLTELNRGYDEQIVDVTPLASLTHLTWLTLSNNQISDAKPLEGLTSLIEIDLSENPWQDQRCPAQLAGICRF
ncbi:MAG: leucine-rich repeat domain-containing protein [Cyanobacteria bacterium J06636_16]